MEWIIGGLIVWNIILMAEISRVKRGVTVLAIGLYKIAKGEDSWQNFVQECERSKGFRKILRDLEIESLRRQST